MARDPAVIVRDPANVEVDGVNRGAVVDVLKNHPEHSTAVQAALGEWRGRVEKDHGERAKEMQRGHLAEAEAERNRHREELESKVAEFKARIAVLEEEVARLKEARRAECAEKDKLIEALGGTELGRRMRLEQRQRAAEQKRAEAEAELANVRAAQGADGGPTT